MQVITPIARAMQQEHADAKGLTIRAYLVTIYNYPTSSTSRLINQPIAYLLDLVLCKYSLKESLGREVLNELLKQLPIAEDIAIYPLIYNLAREILLAVQEQEEEKQFISLEPLLAFLMPYSED